MPNLGFKTEVTYSRPKYCHLHLFWIFSGSPFFFWIIFVFLYIKLFDAKTNVDLDRMFDCCTKKQKLLIKNEDPEKNSNYKYFGFEPEVWHPWWYITSWWFMSDTVCVVNGGEIFCWLSRGIVLLRFHSYCILPRERFAAVWSGRIFSCD